MKLPHPTPTLGRKLDIACWVVTLLVWLLVGAMRRPEKIPLPDGWSFAFLPLVNAVLNMTVANLLITAWIAIKCHKIDTHRRAIHAAMICSGLFLLSYVAYHFTTPETRFGGSGTIRTVYYTILISHIVLAGLSLPFILLTWVRGFTGQVDRHRRLARWVFPVWLYVAISGPICYFMLAPYYAQ